MKTDVGSVVALLLVAAIPAGKHTRSSTIELWIVGVASGRCG